MKEQRYIGWTKRSHQTHAMWVGKGTYKMLDLRPTWITEELATDVWDDEPPRKVEIIIREVD